MAAAVFDLASAAVLEQAGTFVPFLEGYLEELGEPWSAEDVEAIRLDARRAEAFVLPGRGLPSRGRLAPWTFASKDAADVRALLDLESDNEREQAGTSYLH